MIFLFCGKSGSGKDTMLRMLTNTQIRGNSFLPVVSYTTRPKRENETDGIDYHFISKDEFMSRTKNATKDNIGSIFEFRKYNTLVNNKPDVWLYGSPVVDMNGTNTHYAAVVDIEGVRSYINFYGAVNCCVIMMNTDDDIREQRAKTRGSFDKTEWDRRLADDAIKFSEKNTNGIVDYMVDNNADEHKAYAEVCKIISKIIKNINNGYSVAFYGTDNLLAGIPNRKPSADSIRNLVAKIPFLDIEARAKNAIDILDETDLAIALSNNPSVRKYICKNADNSRIVENCVTAIIALAVHTIDNIALRSIYVDTAGKFLLVTDTDLPWRLSDDEIDSSPSHIEHILNKWVSFLTGNNDEKSVVCREFTCKLNIKTIN